MNLNNFDDVDNLGGKLLHMKCALDVPTLIDTKLVIQL